MRRSARLVSLSLPLVLGSCGTASSDAFIPRVGSVALSASVDATITDSPANDNLGDKTWIEVRKQGHRRALVGMDPGAIAAAVASDEVVVSAHLELTIENATGGIGPAGKAVGVHALLEAFTESGATWNCPDDSNTNNNGADCALPWDMAGGGAYQASPLATTTIHKHDSGTVELDVTGHVQAVLAGTTVDHGWLLRGVDEDEPGHVKFGSREGGNAPRLLLVTELAPPSSDGTTSTGDGGMTTAASHGGTGGTGDGGTDTDGEPPPLPVPAGTVQGRLVSSGTSTPIAGARVSVGDTVVTTDNNGAFVLAGVGVGGGQVVVATAEGFSTASTHVDVLEGATSIVELCAALMVVDDIPAADEAFVVVTEAGVQIDVPPLAFVDAMGMPVVGPVQLSTTLLNTAESMAAAPGDMMADDQGTEGRLESFGMVEFQFTHNGEHIDLAPGTPVEIRIPLSAGHGWAQGQLVGLWTFSEDDGVWLQEGDGTIDGDEFVATVDHFSWWNADMPITSTGCVTGVLLDEGGMPVPGAAVTLFGIDYNGQSTDQTAADGSFCVDGLTGGTGRIQAFAFDPAVGITLEWNSGNACVDDLDCAAPSTCVAGTCGFSLGDAVECSGGGCTDLGALDATFTAFTCVGGAVPQFVDLNPTPEQPDEVLTWRLEQGGAPVDSGAVLGEALFEDRGFCLSSEIGAANTADTVVITTSCGEFPFPLDQGPAACGSDDCQALDLTEAYACQDPGPGGTGTSGGSEGGGPATDGGGPATAGGSDGGPGDGGGVPGVCDPPDADGDGLSVCQGDCDDADASVYPGAVELCTGMVDSDCDGYGDDNPPETQCVASVQGEGCFDFVDIGFGGSFSGDLATATQDTPTCFGGADLVYRLAVPEGDGRQIFLTNSHDDGVKFSLAWDSCEAGPMECWDGDGEMWLPPGQYFLVASVFDPMLGTAFDFSVSQFDPQTGTCTPELDDDGDGYSVCGGDCNDADAAVNPGATEVCGDATDNDCSGGVDDPQDVCSTGLPGVCGVGVLGCVGADLECFQAVAATSEICGDGDDNDCDGFVDATDPEGCTTLAAGSTCATAIDLDASGLAANGSFAGAFDSVSDQCAGGQYDRVLTFTVPAGVGVGTGGGSSSGSDGGAPDPMDDGLTQVRFYAPQLGGGGGAPGMDTGFSLYREDCGDPSAFVGCTGFGMGDQLEMYLEPGAYYIVASSYQPTGNWAVQIGITDPDDGSCIPADGDADGQTACAGDCYDADAAMFAGNPEVCGDDVDNDCDGMVDAIFGGCSTGLPGVCDAGTQFCDGAAIGCAAQHLPGQSPELCGDGLDNDCDGATDLADVEGCTTVPVGETCAFPIDLGSGGVASGSMAGATADLPDAGMCWPNGADIVIAFGVPDLSGGDVDVRFDFTGSDGVGYTLYANGCGDEGGGQFQDCLDAMEWQTQRWLAPGDYYLIVNDFSGAGSYSVSVAMFDEMGSCWTPDDDMDGFDPCTGDCAEGNASVFPGAAETCNGIDDNCNGQVDDLGGGCGTGLPGQCADGVQVCNGAAIDCNPTTPASTELCGDGIDNDCDGLTDEDAVADPATPCVATGVADTCLDAVDLGFGGSYSGTLSGASNSYEGGCGMGGGSDHFVRFEVPAGDWVTRVNVSADPSMSVTVLGGGDCGMLLTQECWGAGSHQTNLGPGAYWLMLESTQTDPGLLGYAVSIASMDMMNPGVCTIGDADGDMISICEGDCDDGDAAVFPGQTEDCSNGVDDDCDGVIDDVVGQCSTGQPGVCDAGHLECVGGMASCVSDGPQPEVCDDFVDGSCDGTDNDGGTCMIAAPGEHCGNAIDVSADGHITGDLSTATDDLSDGCAGGGDSPELVFAFDVPADGNQYSARILGTNDPMADCVQISHLQPWETCDPTQPGPMCQGNGLSSWNGVEPGTHTLIISETDWCGGAAGAFDLQLVLHDVTNDLCLLAADTDVDGDGSTICNDDCDDADPARFPGNAETCDGIDNDCDGQFDELDTACGTGLAGICADGHEVCFGSGASLCVQTELARDEICADSLDNDCDGVTDEDVVADPVGNACNVYPPGSCEFPYVAVVDVPFGADLSASTDDIEDCATCGCNQGPEDVIRFEVPAGGVQEVTFDFSGTDDAVTVSLFDNSPCETQQGPFECFQPGPMPGGAGQVRLLAPGTYYLVAESWDPLTMGNYSVTLSMTAP
jgi:hypothetical protein